MDGGLLTQKCTASKKLVNIIKVSATLGVRLLGVGDKPPLVVFCP